MKIKKSARLLAALTLTLAVIPMAPAQTSASCEGVCGGASEILFSCPGTLLASMLSTSHY